ncbi:MAG TPA: cell division protein FtsQ/DivIB [Steroidobacteraceae bacterium]|nr:cell division protein FtsQ/DivIB [Steroidobacteraceae bacterium]
MFKRSATRRNQRRREGPSRLRRLLAAVPLQRALPVAACALVAAGAFFGLRLLLDRPLTQVHITGRFQRVQPLDVEKAVRSQVGRQGLVSVDLAAVSRAVRQIPWVDRATVGRAWPQGLTVEVVEQIPVARWGETGLLNARGERFLNDSRHLPAELPVLAGPAGFEAGMTERYLAMQPRLVEAGMRLARLTLDERGAWELTLASGVRLRLGRAHIEERFDRFMLAASRIVAARATEIAYVDLRYSAGFAIGWRPGGGEVTRG